MKTPIEITDALLESFLRYYDTAYKLRNTALMAERRELLSTPGATVAAPFLELLPDYAASEESLTEFGERNELQDWAAFVALGLMPFPKPYAHQLEALSLSLAHENVVLTTGTGSGKTEALLMPILARLIRESRSWSAPDQRPDAAWWRQPRDPFLPQRTGENRPRAVRALILYPMNALVEDQMVRLRKALDSERVSAWLEAHRASNRFYFGRYTGRTPVPGVSDTDSKDRLNLLREILAETEGRRDALVEQIASNAFDPDHLFQLPNLMGSEMRSRWDMQASAPDILITNYSMLSISLSREDEEAIFEDTRRWLAASADNVFTLAIDELHMYRGTAGTEVAYLLRRLIRRLGLDSRPDQLSIVATSASLSDDEDGHKFLADFFGTPALSFKIVSTEPVAPNESGAKEDNESTSTQIRSDFFTGTSPSEHNRPRSFADVAKAMFPAAAPKESMVRLDELIGTLEDENPSNARLRLHLFFRTLQGIWACCDPGCKEVNGNADASLRRIGKLFSSPRFACECGARVLELLYCESCGEAMLGGYLSKSHGRSYLVGSSNDFESAPLTAASARTHANYRIYWPTTRAAATAPWKRTTSQGEDGTKDPLEFSFPGVVLDPATGEMRTSSNRAPATGLTFEMKTKSTAPRVSMPALPTRCPSCADDQEKRIPGAGIESLARSRSPIRTHGVGFDRVLDVLVGALKRATDSKLVVFSDSRQGAAKVAANLEVSHYQDLVRLILIDAVSESKSQIPIASSGGDIRHLTTDELGLLERTSPREYLAYLKFLAGLSLNASEKTLLGAYGTLLGIDQFSAIVKSRLLSLGMNPAGSHFQTLQQTSDGAPWDASVDWTALPSPSLRATMTLDEESLWREIDGQVSRQVVRTIFAGGDRDLESLHIGFMTPREAVSIDGLDDLTALEFTRSIVRIMGKKRRVQDQEDPQRSWPSRASTYAKAVAQLYLGVRWETLLEGAGRHIGVTTETGYLLSLSSLGFRPGTDAIWKCESCEAIHLHPSAGVCATCFKSLAQTGTKRPLAEPDYYSWLASERAGFSRLRVEELTGQTDISDAQSRQARFQDVFLGDSEHPKPHGIDMLSVTTTMEAGVDIGSLSAVVMANMPPQRFNYQQRVGRAGRRNQHLSVALTIARGGRSHDEFYFANPKAITGDPPPQPFIDLSSLPIAKRSIAAELLTEAFFEVVKRNPSFSRGRSVHGGFGTVEFWTQPSAARSDARRWLSAPAHVRSAIIAVIGVRETPNLQILTRWAEDELLAEIDSAVSESTPNTDLSERLANSGILPMFGFPTQVKSLFTTAPISRGNVSTMDREAGLAISEFAPGRELVKDKAVHVVVGVVSYAQSKRGLYSEGPAPLGTESRVGLCSDCLAMERPDLNACPVCGSADKYTSVTVVEPEAYRTSYKPNNFEQLADGYSTASAPRIFVPNLSAKREMNAYVRVSSNGEVIRVNDNNGDLFSFVQAKSYDRRQPGLIEETYLSNRGKAHRAHTTSWKRVDEESKSVALASRRHTDIVLLEAVGYPDGFALDPRRVESRAAWISAGYLLRAIAARTMDIGPDELEVGVFSSGDGNRLTSGVFLADSLANGAGYAARIAEDVGELLRSAQDPNSHTHVDGGLPCESSCHRCLRDYRNWQWHPLLDWRLAADVADLCATGKIDLERHSEYAEGLVRSLGKQIPLTVRQFSDHLVVHAQPDSPLAIVHPLTDANPDSEFMRKFSAEHGPKAAVASTFELVRRPELVYSKLLGGN